MHNEYEISTKTIYDIMNNIPQDKWEVVLDELKSLLSQTKAIIDATGIAAKAFGVDVSDLVQIGDTTKWVDDGKNENTFTLTDEEDEYLGQIKLPQQGK